MNKILEGVIALGLILGGLAISAPKADAAVPIFPTCIKTQIDHDTARYWFDPGNLEGAPIRTVTVEGVDLRRRRDGVWVGDAPKVQTAVPDYAYFTYNHSRNYGNWTKCLRPKPRSIY